MRQAIARVCMVFGFAILMQPQAGNASDASATVLARDVLIGGAQAVPKAISMALCFLAGQGWILSLQFSPDGKWVSDGKQLCSIDDGRLVTALDEAVPVSGRKLRVSPDSKSVLVQSSVFDPPVTLAVYALPSFELIKRFPGIDVARSNVWWMPDGERVVVERYRTLMSTESSVSVWSLTTGQQTWTAKTTAPVRSISPDGKTIICADSVPEAAQDRRSYRVELIPVDNALQRKTFVAHSGWIQGVTFSPDSKSLATSGADKMVKIWSVPDGALQRTLTGHSGVVFDLAFTRDGSTLLSVSGDKTVRFWNRVSGESLGVASMSDQGVLTAVALSPDERWIALADMSGRALLYDFESIRERAGMSALRSQADPHVHGTSADLGEGRR